MKTAAAGAGEGRIGRRAVVVALVAVAVAGLLVALFLFLFERVREEREVGYRGEAARNPLLAFERLVDRLGVPAERSADPLALPSTGHALFALGAHHPPGTVYLERLIAWVEAGGHLILVPASGSFGETSYQPLLEWIEIEVVWPEGPVGDEGEDEEAADEPADEAADETTGEPAPAQAEGEDEGEGEDEDADDAATGDDEPFDLDEIVPPPPPIELSAGPGSPTRRVSMPRWPVLRDFGWTKPLHHSGRTGAPSLVAYRWGRGRITVLADAGFLENRLLGEHDHARFAWDLLAAGGRPAGLSIVDWRRALPLSRLMARRGWPLALAGALLLAAWIALRGARLGPPLPDDPPPRRSLLEHLRASGDYLWRRGEAGTLLAASRAAVARRLDLAHADWARQPEGERVRRLARLSGVPAGTVAAALEGDAADATDFVRTVATLERLRRSS